MIGTTFGLSGSLSCHGNLLGGKSVTLMKKPAGASSWIVAGSGNTDSEDAMFAFMIKPSVNTAVKMTFAGDTLCAPAESPISQILVRPGVAFNVAKNGAPKAGQTVTFAGSVKPAHPKHLVTLQVLQGGAWRNAVSTRLDSSSSYRLAYTRRSGKGPLLFRVAYPTQDADHAWNISRTLRVSWS